MSLDIAHTLVCADHKSACHYNYQIDPSFQVKCDHCGKQAVRGEMTRTDSKKEEWHSDPDNQAIPAAE